MVEVKIPRENANDDFVVITKVNVKNGDKIEVGDVLFEFETSKAVVEFESIHNGYLSDFYLSTGAKIPVDKVVGSVSKFALESVSEENQQNYVSSAEYGDNAPFISTAAELLIQQGKKPIKNKMWITTRDFENSTNYGQKKIPPASKTKTVFAKSNENGNGSYTVTNINSRKKSEINSLGESSSHYQSMLGVSFKLGKRYATNQFFEHSILDLVVYEASLLLGSAYSDLNSFFIEDDKIGQWDQVVPGIALDDVNNLVVGSISEFENLSDLSTKIIDLVIRFEERKLKPNDLKSSTFTVTDMSTLGIDFVLPLVSGQQCFILGITKSEHEYHIFGSFDHRITEGRRFSSFLLELKNRVLLYAVQHKNAISGKFCSICASSTSDQKFLGNRGLLKIDDGTGEKLVCKNCFEGW